MTGGFIKRLVAHYPFPNIYYKINPGILKEHKIKTDKCKKRIKTFPFKNCLKQPLVFILFYMYFNKINMKNEGD